MMIGKNKIYTPNTKRMLISSGAHTFLPVFNLIIPELAVC